LPLSYPDTLPDKKHDYKQPGFVALDLEGGGDWIFLPVLPGGLTFPDLQYPPLENDRVDSIDPPGE
jgi:hypothetical protein